MCFCACLKSNFLDSSQFRNLHVNTTAMHRVKKDPMSDVPFRHQNWYIKKKLSGSLKISNRDRSNDLCVLFGSIIQLNAVSCRSVYSRAAFNGINTVTSALLFTN